MPKTRARPAPPPLIKPETIITPGTTLADRIIEHVTNGTTLEHAALACGVPTAEIRRWMRTGADTLAQLDTGRHKWERFTLHEQHLARFAVDVMRAEGEAIARANAALDQLARGVITVTETRTITYDDDGTEVQQLTARRTTQNAPDARVIMWRLERRYPMIYGSQARRGDDLPDDADDTDVTSRMIERLDTMGDRLALPAGDPEQLP